MTTSYPLISLTDVKSFLDIRPEITKADFRLKLLLGTATKMIEKATRRIFTKQDIVEFFTSRDNVRVDYDLGGVADFGQTGSYFSSGLLTQVKPQTFYLSGINIDRDAPFSVWYDPYSTGTTPYSDDALLVAGVDYQIDYDQDALIIYTGTRYAIRAIKVAYNAGYEPGATDGEDSLNLSAAIPDDLKLAVMTQVQFLNVKLRADNIGMAAERTVGAKDRIHTADFLAVKGLAPEVVGMLGDMKRLRLGTS